MGIAVAALDARQWGTGNRAKHVLVEVGLAAMLPRDLDRRAITVAAYLQVRSFQTNSRLPLPEPSGLTFRDLRSHANASGLCHMASIFNEPGA
jgi:hypothetical protein